MSESEVIGGEEKSLDSGFILKEEPSGLDIGCDGKRGVKEDGSLTNGEYWGWSSFGRRPGEQFGFVK